MQIKLIFIRNGCAPSLILKVRAFRTRKWPILQRANTISKHSFSICRRHPFVGYEFGLTILKKGHNDFNKAMRPYVGKFSTLLGWLFPNNCLELLSYADKSLSRRKDTAVTVIHRVILAISII